MTQMTLNKSTASARARNTTLLHELKHDLSTEALGNTDWQVLLRKGGSVYSSGWEPLAITRFC